MKSFVMSVVAAIAFTAPTGQAATPSPDYVITRTVPPGMPDRWDYVTFDPGSGRIYMATADITASPKAAPNDDRHRYSVKPGTVRLLLLDPNP